MQLKPPQKAGLRRPRLGFVGLGWIGRHRMEAIAATGLTDIIAFADPSDSAVEEALHHAPDAARCATLEDVLAEAPDGIVIATPSALHAEQTIAALNAGIAVFCQKPLGRTADEAAAAVEAARNRDLLLGVDLSYRHTEGMRAIRDLLARGALGQVFAANLVFHNAYGPDKSWFYDPTQSGGGCVMDLGVHLIDLALWALDFPAVEDVSARLYRDGAPWRGDGVEDFAAVTLTLASGAVLRMTCSWKLQAGCDAVIAAEFFGTGGGAALRNVSGSFYDFAAQHHQGTASTTLAAPPDDWGGRAAADWAARLAAGEGFDPRNEELVTLSRTLDRIYAAALEGR